MDTLIWWNCLTDFESKLVEKMQRIAVWIAALTILTSGCQKDYIGQAEIRANIEESELFLRSVEKLTDVQIHDIFAPPVAARVYAYPCIAAYESMVPA